MKRWLLSVMAVATLRAQQVPADRAMVRLERYEAVIASRARELDALYEGTNFGGGLEAHLRSAGGDPGSPDRHLIRWDWESVRSTLYYGYHLEALATSVQWVRQHGSPPAADMAAIDRGMQSWLRYEPDLRRAFAAQFDLLVKLGDQYGESDHFDSGLTSGLARARFFAAIGKPQPQLSGNPAAGGEPAPSPFEQDHPLLGTIGDAAALALAAGIALRWKALRRESPRKRLAREGTSLQVDLNISS